MKTVFVVLSLLLAGVSLSTANQCRWGPSYWCKDHTTAEKCGQVRYCQENIWSQKDKVDEPLDLECTLCETVVDFIDQYIDSNSTEAEAEEIILNLCGSLGTFADECKEFVNRYFPDLWKLLQEQTDPTKVCVELGLCSSAAVIKLKVDKPLGIECTVCKMVVEWADQYLDKNDTEEEAEAIVLKYCSDLGPFASECESLVKEFFPDIWKMLISQMDPDTICSEIGVCSSATVKKVDKPLGIECTVCKMVVEWADQYLDKNDTEEEAEAIVLKYCSDLGPFASECESLVKEFFPDIWKMLISQMDPDTICSEIGVCSSATVKKVDKPLGIECTVCKMVVEWADQYLDKNDTEEEAEAIVLKYCSDLGPFASECESLVKEFFPDIWKMLIAEMDPDTICSEIGVCSSATVKKVDKPLGIECTVCKMVVEWADQYLDKNDTEEEAEAIVLKYCSDLGGFASECESLVKEFFPAIWKMLIAETDPDTICSMLGFCSSATVKKVDKTEGVKADGCDFCKDVCEFLQTYVDDNATKNEVEAFLKELCNLVPIFQDECSTILADFDAFWKLIQSEVDGDDICFQLGLCTSKVAIVTTKVPRDDDLCKLCKYIVELIKPYIDENGTGDEVKDFLESLCRILPSPLNSTCHDLIADNFDLAWVVFKDEVDNGDLCTLLEICNDTVSVATKPKVAMATPHVEEPEFILCKLCELVMEKIESMLVNNATREEIVELVEKICTFFPSAEQKYCKEFIQDYGNKIIEALVDGVGPKLVCTIIGLCVEEEQRTETTFSFNMKSGSGECDVCEMVLTFVKEILGENISKKAVDDLLDDVCKLFPSALQDECKAFVDEYSAEVVQLIDDSIDPEKLCQDIKLCPKTSVIAAPWKMLEKGVPFN